VEQRSDDKGLNRRDFIIRSVRAGGLIAAAGLLAYRLHDDTGLLGLSSDDEEQAVLKDYSVPGAARRMSIVTGEDRVKSVRLGLEAIGGIETFIRRGDKVLIKVNAAFATAPSLSATTNPQLLSEVVRLCLKAGASGVTVTDNPINDPESCFALTGIGEAARSSGAKVVYPKEAFFRPITLQGGNLIKKWPLLYVPFEGVDKVIGIAPVKDHHRSGASMTMKNWYGLLGGRRNMFHQNIHNFIMELSMMVTPTLVILDGVTAMMTNGPTGGSLADLKQTNTLIIGTDQVAADAFGATLLGKTVYDLPYIMKADAAGAGTADFESLKPARVTAG
jgi:uncharacterized protein (DUF362 family)